MSSDQKTPQQAMVERELAVAKAANDFAGLCRICARLVAQELKKEETDGK